MITGCGVGSRIESGVTLGLGLPLANCDVRNAMPVLDMGPSK